VVTLRVKSGAAVGAKIGLKLENSLDGGKFVITEAVTTKQNEWETLSFDFATLTAGAFDVNATYNMASVFPAFSEKGGASPALTGNTEFYFDELKYAVATVTPPPPPTPSPSNLVANGNFANGATGWSGNAVQVRTEGGNSFNFADVTTAGPSYNVNLSYVLNIPTSGVAYKLRFKASSNRNRTMVAGIGLNQDPWTNVTQTVNVTTTLQTFELALTSNFANANSRVLFDMGADTGNVAIDDVELVVDTAPAPPPSSGIFSSGFASNILTKDGGAVVSSGGSDLDGWNCTGGDAWCGSGANAAGGVGADSSMYFYYQTPSVAAGLYSQIEVFAPSVTGFNGSGDTAGVNVAGKTKVNFNFNPNPEWYKATVGGAKVAVVLTLGKRFPIDNGCRLQLIGVKPITSDGNVAYSMNLTSDFRVAADCAQSIPPTDVAAALAKSSVVSSVKFVGADGGAALIGRNEVKSTANLSVKAGNVYPTTVALKGAITFD